MGVQETTGMCRMAGGWPEGKTVKKWDCGRAFWSRSSSTNLDLLVEVTEMTRTVTFLETERCAQVNNRMSNEPLLILKQTLSNE